MLIENRKLWRRQLRRCTLLALLGFSMPLALYLHAGSFDVMLFISIVSTVEPLLLVGLGCGLIIGTGQIDISAGGMLTFLTATLLALDSYSVSSVLAFAVVIGAAISFQLLQTFLIHWGRIPSLLSSLGLSIALFAAAEFLQGKFAEGTAKQSARSLSYFEDTPVLGAGWVGIVIFVATGLLLWVTGQRLKIEAVGQNPQAAVIAGISPRFQTRVAYVFSGLLYGFGAIHLVYWNSGTVDPNQGAGYELLGIALAVIGGCAITGGFVPFGGLLFATAFYGMAKASLPALFDFLPGNGYRIVLGLALWLVLALESLRLPRTLRRRGART